MNFRLTSSGNSSGFNHQLRGPHGEGGRGDGGGGQVLQVEPDNF